MSNQISYKYKDVKVEHSNSILKVQNSVISRVFDLSSGIPRTVSMEDKVSGEAVAVENTDRDFSFIGINMPGSGKVTDYIISEITVSEKEATVFDGEHVVIDIMIHERVQHIYFVRRYIIYPGMAVIASQTSIKCYTSPNIYWGRRTEGFNENIEPEKLESCADVISLADGFKIKKSVQFFGRTDVTNELVVEHKYTGKSLNGNLLYCENGCGNGLFILQEAPPSSERRDYEMHDFRIDDKVIFTCCWGIEPQGAGENELWSYRHVVGIFSNDGTHGSLSLKKYLKERFPLDMEKNTSVMVNPWGCGCFRELVTEDFLKEEFKASGEINATHYQIDDGWEAGEFLAEFEQNNRYPGKDFWRINYKLLPNGFGPVLKTAKTAGVEAALWMAPSAHCHYRDWKMFADILYNYYIEYGFKNFKIDFVRTRTKDAEDNLERMLKYLRDKSEGEIFFNLDTTSGQRPGYFMFLEYGNIFLENRYTCHNWGMGYHPEDTLNNFWNLSRYMRPQSLQIEFSDPDIINDEFYMKRGTTRPDAYPCDYWAAIAMFANPLVWLAPSRLSDEVKAIYRDMISLHRKYKQQIFGGEIFPIGSQPDGESITGFQSHNSETGEGVFIVYCELEAPLEGEINLKLLKKDRDYKVYEVSLEKEKATNTFDGSNFFIEFDKQASWKMYVYR